MRRALLVLALALGGVGFFAGGLAWLLNDPRPPAGASRGERLYVSFCAGCHGLDGRGSWRAVLFLIRPGDLTVATEYPDQYVFDIIKHGGASIGRPGMPAFGAQLSDDDIRALVAYLETLRAHRHGGLEWPHTPTFVAPRRSRGAPLYPVYPDVLLANPLDPDEDDGVAVLPSGEAHAVAWRQMGGVERRRRATHGHHLHGAHAEAGDGLVANEDEIGAGAGDQLAADLEGRGTDDRSPEAGREEADQDDEEDDDEAARTGAPAQRAGVIAPTRRRGPRQV